ncbi:MAG: hypothetical protein IID40_02765 [Planctomycetes bacterium]|nr:hypothetical protein [Planctomycetota bacterium]
MGSESRDEGTVYDPLEFRLAEACVIPSEHRELQVYRDNWGNGESFYDYNTMRERTDLGLADVGAAGVCSGGDVVFLQRARYADAFETFYYDGRSGEFRGFEQPNYETTWICHATLAVWPRRIICVDPTITEYYTGNSWEPTNVDMTEALIGLEE